MRLHAVILAAFIASALLGDALFQDAALGLNVPLGLGTLLAAAGVVHRRSAPGDSRAEWLLAVAVFFAACLAWRASPFLRFWSGVAVLSAGVAAATALRVRLLDARALDYARGAVDLAARLAGGVVMAAAALTRPEGGRSAFAARVRASGVGLALTLPVVFVFGSLLASADPVLEGFVDTLFSWQAGFLVDHLVLMLLCGWIGAGVLGMPAGPRPAAGSPASLPAPRTLGLTEIGLPLGALVALLAAFIGLQVRYVFGGAGVVQSTGFTYAELARRGFFELVAVAALVVPLLWAAQWMVDRGRRPVVDGFRALVVVISLLVGLVMISALARMGWYVAAYGLTEDRLYATAFMGWVGAVLAWFALTEFRAGGRRFATGAVVGGFALLAVLAVLDPDGLIVRTNVARARSGAALDASYLGRLSLDAVPAVVRAWPGLDADARCELRRTLLARVRPVDDWREWTWAATAAADAAARLPADEECPRAE